MSHLQSIHISPMRFCEELLYRGLTVDDLKLVIVDPSDWVSNLTGTIREHSNNHEVYVHLSSGGQGNYEKYIDRLLLKFDSDRSILSFIIERRDKGRGYVPYGLTIENVKWDDSSLFIQYRHNLKAT